MGLKAAHRLCRHPKAVCPLTLHIPPLEQSPQVALGGGNCLFDLEFELGDPGSMILSGVCRAEMPPA